MPTNLNNLDPKVMPRTGKGFFNKSHGLKKIKILKILKILILKIGSRRDFV